MPITVKIPAGSEAFDSETLEFLTVNRDISITLEHSLVSIQKWEQKWHVAFLDPKHAKTTEQTLDYLRCMTLSKNNIEDYVYRLIPREEMERIKAYIENPMTATTIKESGRHGEREIKTAEVLYSDMILLGIPFECKKWHLNSLIMLINVCSEKQKPPKKMSPAEIAAQNRALNRARRAALNSKG